MSTPTAEKKSKTHFLNTKPVLAVVDLKRSTEFYVDTLGFTDETGDIEGWSFLRREQVRVFLGSCPDEKPAGEIGNHSYVAYIEVQGIDELYREFKDKDVDFIADPESKPWGMREFGIRTPDGHRFMFGQEIERILE